MVDYAIPQSFFDTLNQSQRDDSAGWFYDSSTARLGGRHLTRAECWRRIALRLRQGELVATMMGIDVSYAVTRWPCLRIHVERSEIQLACQQMPVAAVTQDGAPHPPHEAQS
jgi:hypothetical protein